LTDTRSSAVSAWNHSAVMIEVIEALDAWCPPTFSPERFGRTRLAWSTIAVDSHSTRRSQKLAEIAEVVEVFGLSGETDLLVRVVAADAEDLYRIAGQILAIPGIERTTTALAMRELVPHRLTGLLLRRAEGR
jgi:DNA-binding Lrp family transcriptional regulator